MNVTVVRLSINMELYIAILLPLYLLNALQACKSFSEIGAKPSSEFESETARILHAWRLHVPLDAIAIATKPRLFICTELS